MNKYIYNILPNNYVYENITLLNSNDYFYFYTIELRNKKNKYDTLTMQLLIFKNINTNYIIKQNKINEILDQVPIDFLLTNNNIYNVKLLFNSKTIPIKYKNSSKIPGIIIPKYEKTLDNYLNEILHSTKSNTLNLNFFITKSIFILIEIIKNLKIMTNNNYVYIDLDIRDIYGSYDFTNIYFDGIKQICILDKKCHNKLITNEMFTKLINKQYEDIINYFLSIFETSSIINNPKIKKLIKILESFNKTKTKDKVKNINTLKKKIISIIKVKKTKKLKFNIL